MWYKMVFKEWSGTRFQWVDWKLNRNFGSLDRWIRRNVWNQRRYRQFVKLHYVLSILYLWRPAIAEVILTTKITFTSSMCSKVNRISSILQKKRDSLVASSTGRATQICKKYDISAERRIERKNKVSDDKSSDSGISSILETRREQLEALD